MVWATSQSASHSPLSSRQGGLHLERVPSQVYLCTNSHGFPHVFFPTLGENTILSLSHLPKSWLQSSVLGWRRQLEALGQGSCRLSEAPTISLKLSTVGSTGRHRGTEGLPHLATALPSNQLRTINQDVSGEGVLGQRGQDVGQAGGTLMVGEHHLWLS